MLVDKNKKIIKALSIIGIVLASGGLVLLIFLEIKFLNLPSSELASFSETFHLPSSVISYLTPKILISQSLPTPTPTPAPPAARPTGGSTTTAVLVSPYRVKFTGVLVDDIKLVFPNPNYQELNNLIADAAKQTDLNNIYGDYKKAFNLMKVVYLKQQDNLEMRTVLLELKMAAFALPQFTEADMEIPK